LRQGCLLEVMREIGEAEPGDVHVNVAIGFFRPAT
jgi:hypothetical protein